ALHEIDGDHGLGAAAMPLGIRAKAGQVHDRVVGAELLEFVGSRANEHGSDKTRMPGKLSDDANADTVFSLRSAKQVLDEYVVERGKVLEEVRVELLERLAVHGLVRSAPPDIVLG